MKRIAYLATAALVALLILVSTAVAQQTTPQKAKGGSTTKVERTTESTQPLPKSGGPAVGSMLLPAGALLMGSGVLAYAVLRRR